MWKEVKGFNGLYSVSNNGEVKNNYRNSILAVTYNKDHKNKLGYKIVKLQIPYNRTKGEIKKYKTLYIHRLVAEYFIDNVENKKCINHIDGNKHNNHYTNLEWVTYKENMTHSITNNLHSKLFNTKLSIVQLDEAISLVINNKYSTKDLMKYYGVCTNISNWINKRAKLTGLYDKLKEAKLQIKKLATSNKVLRNNIVYYGINSNGLSTKEYKTLTDAANDLNLNPGNISNSINKGYKCGGYLWKLKKLQEQSS